MAGNTASCLSLGYSSVIKIDGRRILPPLIDEEYRAELLQYKHLAVLLESKHSNTSNLHEFRFSVDSGMFTASGSEQTLNNSPTQLMSNSGVSCGPLQVGSSYDNTMFTQSDVGNETDCNLYSAVSNIEDIVLKSLENGDINEQCSINGEHGVSLDMCNIDSEKLQKNSIEQGLEESLCNKVTGISSHTCVVEELQTIIPKRNAVIEMKDNVKELQTEEIQNGINISSNDCYKPIQIVSEIQYKNSSMCLCIDIGSKNEDNDVAQCCNITSDKGESGLLVVCDSKSCTPMVPLCNDEKSTCSTYPTMRPDSDLLQHTLEDNTLLSCFPTNTELEDDLSKPWKPLYSTISNISELPFIDDDIPPCNSKAEYELIDIPSSSLSYTICNIPQQDSLPVNKSHTAERDYDIKVNDGYAGEIPICRTSDTLIIEPNEAYEECVLQQSDITSDMKSVALCTSELNGHSPSHSIEINHCSMLRAEMPFNSSKTDINSSLGAMTILDPKECDTATVLKDKEEDGYATPIRLMRRNSYTLEAPSPVLLAHLEAVKKSENTSIKIKTNNCTKQTRKGWNLAQTKADWNSETTPSSVFAFACKQSQIIRSKKTSSPAKHERHTMNHSNASLPSSIASSPVKINCPHGSLDSLSPVFSRKHQNTPSNTKWSPVSSSSKKSGSTEIHHKKRSPKTIKNTALNALPSVNLENDLKYNKNGSVKTNSCAILQPNLKDMFIQMQLQHSQQMAELLTKQKLEQETLRQAFLNQQKQMLSEINVITSEAYSVPLVNLLHAEPDTQEEVSQNASSAEGLLPSTSVKTPFLLECAASSKSCSTQVDLSSVASEVHKTDQSTPMESTRLASPISVSCESRLSNSIEMIHLGNSNKRNEVWCSRQLFQNEETETASMADFLRNKLADHLEMKQKERAACLINAAARGYLTRRLLKTEYVQECINRITDTVHCAIQLQQECPVDLHPSDVELHRRLIQQLTAACHTLHDTFFILSIPERMTLIAVDRERLRTQMSKQSSSRVTLSLATQRTLKRKQLQLDDLSTDRSLPSSRKVWDRNKGRASSADRCEVPVNCISKQQQQVSTVTKSQRPVSGRTSRRPWR